MQRGTITILVIVGVALAAATASVVYHYSNQKHAQDFWGSATAKLIGNPSPVEALELKKADRNLSLDGDDEPAAEESNTEQSQEKSEATEKVPEKESGKAPEEPAPPTVKAFDFDGTAWIVSATKDAAAAKGINNLRRALVLDTTYNWSEQPPAGEPVWKYGLAMTDERDWVTVLFDFDSRRIALAGGRRTAVLNPEASAEFQQFFSDQFASGTPATEATPDKAATPQTETAQPAPTESTPAEPAATK
jgi:hypothetical protein